METDAKNQSFESLMKDLEIQELEAPGAVANAQLYGRLLCLYLLQNDNCNAKFLWKRIPQQVKTGNAELGHIWTIGQKMWVRDFPGIYESLKRDWSEAYKDIITAISQATRKRAMYIVAQAFSSINVDMFAAYLGLSVNEAVQAAQTEGWQTDQQSRLILPNKPAAKGDPPLPNEQHLSVLTDYVSFLES